LKRNSAVVRKVIAYRSKKIRATHQNSVDSSDYLPQYHGVWGFALLQVGLAIQYRAESTLKGKIVHGGTFMATKKKAKKKKKH
jgi:hypothetical protein